MILLIIKNNACITILIYLEKSNLNYKYIICQRKINSLYSKVIICLILTRFLILPSFLKLENFTTPNESLMSVSNFVNSLTYVIESIESKLISACLINYYSLIA